MKYFIIGDEDSVRGFGMVGVKGKLVSNAQEAEEAFQSVLQDREVGIVVITERIAELIRPQVDRYMFTEVFPLIVEIPDRLGQIVGKLNLRETVNRAIGIRL